MKNILPIVNILKDWSDEHGVLIDKFCYCYHHPKGIVSEYTEVCDCRKIGKLFLNKLKNNSILILLYVGLLAIVTRALNMEIALGVRR